ncbi:hypothetical protein GR268_43355, partial [Rhizobium leguminosarum]|nr:hypothetical protein [Rhizobium leguminosarum]
IRDRDSLLLPDSVTTQAAAETLVWQQVRAVFDPTSQLVYWGWGAQQQGCIRAGTLNKQLKVKNTMPLVAPLNGGTQVNTVIYQDELYCVYQGPKNEIWYNVFENHSWQPPVQAPGEALTYTPTAVVDQGKLYCFYRKWVDGKGNLYYNALENGQWQSSKPVDNVDNHIIYAPSAVLFKGNIYIFFQNGDDPGHLLWRKFSNNGILLDKPVVNLSTWAICESPNAVGC